MNAEKIPCSVLVLTRNSAATLERCLRNLTPFGEILVHDANSEDNTVEIARSFGARVLPQDPTTQEKSIRVKNFTEMRLKQRSDAAFDWVLYLDSDESLSDELVAELAGLIPTLPIKTVVKIPRYPVIENIVRKHGLYCPEVMPRLHHRKSGCTLRPGKIVHEKYQYDDSFAVLTTKHPLYFPLESAAELRSKDDRYLTLEVEKKRAEGYPWSQYIRWILLREPLVMLSLLGKIILHIPNFFRKDGMPFSHEWRYVRYHWRLLRAMTGIMLEKSSRA